MPEILTEPKGMMQGLKGTIIAMGQSAKNRPFVFACNSCSEYVKYLHDKKGNPVQAGVINDIFVSRGAREQQASRSENWYNRDGPIARCSR